MAQLHGVYYTVDSFMTAIQQESSSEVREVLETLCKLFAINQIQRLAEPIV